MPVYALPDLPYDYAALEPALSGEILQLHHGKHHAAYVNGANATLEQLAEARADSRWGGLVGLSGNPRLIDGGYTSVPRFAFYDVDGTWGIEGHGVDPDIEVIADPALMVDGGDPQLDAAIELMLDETETNPYVPTPKPVYPNRSGMGIRPEDK